MKPHNRHAIAIFNFFTLLPLVYFIPPWLDQHLTNNHLLVTVTSLMIIVPIISYVTMPLFMKSLKLINER